MDPTKYILELLHGKDVEELEIADLVGFEPDKYHLTKDSLSGEWLFALFHYYLFANGRFIHMVIILEIMHMIRSHPVLGEELQKKLQLMLNDTIVFNIQHWLSNKYIDCKLFPVPHEKSLEQILDNYNKMERAFKETFQTEVKLDNFITRREKSLKYNIMWKDLYEQLLEGGLPQVLYPPLRQYYEQNLLTTEDIRRKGEGTWPSTDTIVQNLKQIREDSSMVEEQIQLLKITEHQEILRILKSLKKDYID